MEWLVPFNGLVFLRCRQVSQRKEVYYPPRRSTRQSRKRRGSVKPRSRPRRERHPKIDPIHSHVRLSNGNLNASVWKVKDITDIHKPLAWVKRESSRFIGHLGPYQVFKVPYLDHLGRRTGEQLYTWYTPLQNFCVSYVATIAKRLRSHVLHTKLKWNRKVGLLSQIVKVAALSFISGKNYLIERFKALLSKRGCNKIINAILRKFISRLDDNTWFVYRHISLQIKWIDLRAREPRDKSKIHSSTVALAEKLGRVPVGYDGIYQALHQVLNRTGAYA